MKKIPIDEIKPFFFKAMLQGYAAGAEPLISTDVPNTKIFSFADGDFELIDTWTMNDRGYLVGSTLILHKEVPVWVMQYRGVYDAEAIPVLKKALRSAYTKEDFNGGRGASRYITTGKKELHYENKVFRNNWKHFLGRETVVRIEAKTITPLGWHEYNGLLLM